MKYSNVVVAGGGLARLGVDVFLGAASEADEVLHRLGGLVLEQVDDDVAAVGVQGDGAHLGSPFGI